MNFDLVCQVLSIFLAIVFSVGIGFFMGIVWTTNIILKK